MLYIAIMKGSRTITVAIAVPPFIQPNSPYPSVTHLTAFLNNLGYRTVPLDLSLEVLLRIFSGNGLAKIFAGISSRHLKTDDDKRVYALKEFYIATIDFVIAFLQQPNTPHAYRLVHEDFLPKGPLFYRELDEKNYFGEVGIVDKAKYYCSLYLDELTFFIQQNVDKHFGFSRYAEHIAQSPSHFSVIENELLAPPTIIDALMEEVFRERLSETKPDVLGISIPFAGNLVAGLKLGDIFKKMFPQKKVVLGGGYVNTELRSLSEPAIFNYVDYITLDDGEMPLKMILKSISENGNNHNFIRTFLKQNDRVVYLNEGIQGTIPHDALTPPSTSGLPVNSYFSMTEVLNPMHRLWSDGFWHKITLAHGCYWHKCTFCDVTLDYIKRYSPARATTIVDRMEKLIAETGIRSFHFTDEAAPPSILKRVALEIIKRRLQIVWWGNIRFDKQFTSDVARLMARSGCVAVSGGLEVAEKRLLKLVNKGVTLEQGITVCHNLTRAGIMVHAYLMYGFPTQTAQETMNSLELVRQLFAHKLIHSAYWHLFTLTVHSPIAADPEKFSVTIAGGTDQPFANNDLRHTDLKGDDPSQFAEGLRKSLYNYMHGIGLDWDVRQWFDHPVPRPTISENFTGKVIQRFQPLQIPDSGMAVWLGSPPLFRKKNNMSVHTPSGEAQWTVEPPIQAWLEERLVNASLDSGHNESFQLWKSSFPAGSEKFARFVNSEVFRDLRELGLLFI